MIYSAGGASLTSINQRVGTVLTTESTERDLSHSLLTCRRHASRVLNMTTAPGRHARFIEKAMQAAEMLSPCRYRLGSVVVKNGNILAVASNRWRNYSATPNPHDITTDAEVAALTMTRNASGATLYVARISRPDKSGICRPTMSKPCIRCQVEIIKAEIKTVVYTDWNGDIVVERVSCTGWSS